ncbi:MAG: hypothetical protein Homavirus20_8 [Homavirus sp.]|uniref:Uncharacterized protein n=1 Tax=Homavirus sp. TaxID=2487769 RepID=A0A3G5A4U2_9VIRU|nr:MAG: hypothetical protein Homavirus20_8 [Homavirus sp.]
MTDIFNKFFDKIPVECYFKSHPGVRTPWEKIECNPYDVNRLLKESIKYVSKDGDRYIRMYAQNGRVFYTTIKSNNTIVFGSDYVDMLFGEFDFSKYKVIFKENDK